MPFKEGDIEKTAFNSPRELFEMTVNAVRPGQCTSQSPASNGRHTSMKASGGPNRTSTIGKGNKQLNGVGLSYIYIYTIYTYIDINRIFQKLFRSLESIRVPI